MKRLKVSLLAFFDNNGQILLNHRKDGLSLHEDVWEIIGGGIGENEEPLEAIKRETIEELNYEISEDKDELVLIEKFEITNDKFFAEIHFFKAKFPGFHNFSDTSEVFVSDLKLFPIDDALNLPLLPICREILKKLK